MSAEWSRPDIARVAPGFGGAPLVLLGEGLDSRAVLAGGSHVFRFPKHPEAGRQLEAEVALLPGLAPRLNLPVPRFEYVGRQEGNGLPFVGYRMIRGVPLDPPRSAALNDQAKDQVFRDLAAFLSALHAFPFDDARRCGVARSDARADVADDLDRARAEIAPRVGREVWDFVESLAEGYLGDPANLDVPPALLHADLSSDHVLISEARQAVAGMIDWGDVSIGDPDYDLMYLYDEHGPVFIGDLLRYHPHPDPPRLLAKLRFWAVFDRIGLALIGLERGDPALVEEGLGPLRAHATGGLAP
jgi:aminoglycoside 2''-phosphotransferase